MIHDNAPQQESNSPKGDTDNNPQASLRVGACSWRHSHWQGEFYPADLPAEWQLSYYANEFNCVLVPFAECPSIAEAENWLDDVSEDFQFYLESDPEGQQCSEIAQLVSGHVQLKDEDILIDGGIAVINPDVKNLREWRHWLEQNSEQLEAVFLKSDQLSYKTLSEFRSLVELLGL